MWLQTVLGHQMSLTDRSQVSNVVSFGCFYVGGVHFLAVNSKQTSSLAMSARESANLRKACSSLSLLPGVSLSEINMVSSPTLNVVFLVHLTPNAFVIVNISLFDCTDQLTRKCQYIYHIYVFYLTRTMPRRPGI